MGQKSEFNGSLWGEEKHKKRQQCREKRDITVLHKERKTVKENRKRQWQQVLWVWAIQGECMLKCDSGLSCTIRLNTVVYGLDSDSSNQEWLFLSLSHTHTFIHFPFIQLNIPWNHTTNSRHEERSPAQLLICILILFLSHCQSSAYSCCSCGAHTPNLFVWLFIWSFLVSLSFQLLLLNPPCEVLPVACKSGLIMSREQWCRPVTLMWF